MCTATLSSLFIITHGKEWKEKYIIWKRGWGKGTGKHWLIHVYPKWWGNGASYILFLPPRPFLLNPNSNFSTWVIFKNYIYLKACFEGSLWIKLQNIKDVTSHRQTTVYRSHMVCICWSIHIPHLSTQQLQSMGFVQESWVDYIQDALEQSRFWGRQWDMEVNILIIQQTMHSALFTYYCWREFKGTDDKRLLNFQWKSIEISLSFWAISHEILISSVFLNSLQHTILWNWTVKDAMGKLLLYQVIE